MQCYLDNSATTRAFEQVVQAMARAMEQDYYNPSAAYAPAVQAEGILSASRRQLMDELGAQRVVFTSGGTEANNLAILGRLRALRKSGRVLYSAGEHPAVRESCLAAVELGYDVAQIPLQRDGRCDMDALQSMADEKTVLICLMQVNNETGAIQPLEAAAAIRSARCPQAFLHVDGVQGFLRLQTDLRRLGIDSYALSGHKIHGPKGVGALALGPRDGLQPLALGGGQENGLRSGTENTPAVAGLAKALELYPRQHQMRALKLRLWEQLRRDIPNVAVNGCPPQTEESVDHILNVSFPPVNAETMLHALEGEGVFVSTGSACSARKKKISSVLEAMQVPDALARSAIRFSFSPQNTPEEIDYAAQACLRSYKQLAAYNRR